MRFGVCAPVQDVPALVDGGYDYCELPLSPTLRPEEPEAVVMTTLRRLPAGLRPETWNLFLPCDLKVVGEQVNVRRQEQYLSAAFGRASTLGGLIVVFGSGGARSVPDGFSPQTAMHQLQEFLRRAGATAAQHGMVVVIEPLNTGECNIINSVGEALTLSHAVAHPSVGVLSDLYHLKMEAQSYEETRLAGSLLRHVHVAGGAGRRAPVREDVPLLTDYFRALKASGYDGRVSVEGHWADLAAQAGETLAVLRDAWAAA